MDFLMAAFLVVLVLSRVFWVAARKWPSSVNKAIILNLVSAGVIIPADYYVTAIYMGDEISAASGILYAGGQFLVFLIDLARMRRKVRLRAYIDSLSPEEQERYTRMTFRERGEWAKKRAEHWMRS